MRLAVLVSMCLLVLASCAQGGAAFQFYVVIRHEDTEKFLGAVTSIAKESGFEIAVGQTRFDADNVLRVLEGRGHGIKLWVQSPVLSGQEDPKLCGVHREPYPDPAQFLVFTEPRFFEFSRASAVNFGKKVLSQLQSSGYDARRDPPVCGEAALRDIKQAVRMRFRVPPDQAADPQAMLEQAKQYCGSIGWKFTVLDPRGRFSCDAPGKPVAGTAK